MFYVKNLKINNFRCYKDKKIDFSDKINVIYGENAVGKTSIIEAIAYLGLCKSFRGAKDRDLIKIGEDYFFIKGEIEDNSQEVVEIIASFSENEKKIKKNNHVFKKLSEYIGYFNVVSFEPSDLDLIKGGPAERRRFLDLNICQFNEKYLTSLMKYNKILKKRNDFLKQIEDLSEKNIEFLNVLDDALVKEADIIIRSRLDFINNINKELNKVSMDLSLSKESVVIEYTPSIHVENFLGALKKKRKYDFISKTTSVGPHRDDFIVKINNNDANLFASQGQTRTAVIAIKLSLAEYLNSESKNIVILLDDVFSELDAKRQNELLLRIEKNKQIFITTTSIDLINDAILNKSKVIKLEKETEVWAI